jgi:hypothetical protein
MNMGLATMLQARLAMQKEFYVENDEVTWRVSIVTYLVQQYPNLLPLSEFKDTSIFYQYKHFVDGGTWFVSSWTHSFYHSWGCQGDLLVGHGNGFQSIPHVLGNVANVLSLVIAPNTFSNLDYGECVIHGWFLNQGVGKCSTYLFLDWTNHVAQCDTNKIKSSLTTFMVN